MPERVIYAIKDFLKLESASGIVLMAAMILAMIMNNSFLDDAYQAFIAIPIVVQFGDLIIDKPLLLWVNDGLMALFFFTLSKVFFSTILTFFVIVLTQYLFYKKAT